MQWSVVTKNKNSRARVREEKRSLPCDKTITLETPMRIGGCYAVTILLFASKLFHLIILT